MQMPFKAGLTIKIKKSHLAQRKSDRIRQVTSYKRFNPFKLSITGEEKGDLLIQVTA